MGSRPTEHGLSLGCVKIEFSVRFDENQRAPNPLLTIYMSCGGVVWIYYLFVVLFYCRASKTINLSLSVEEIHQTFSVKNAQNIIGIKSAVLYSNRLFVQIIPQLYIIKEQGWSLKILQNLTLLSFVSLKALLLPYPGSDIFHPGSQIQGWQDPGSGSASKIWSIFNSKIRSGVFIPDPISPVWIFSILDPGVKKVSDPGSGFATLLSPAGFDKKQVK